MRPKTKKKLKIRFVHIFFKYLKNNFFLRRETRNGKNINIEREFNINMQHSKRVTMTTDMQCI